MEMSKEIQMPDFFIIPTLLLKDREIKHVDYLVYSVIYWFSKLKLEKCIASNTTLADMTSSSYQTIANSLSRLKKKGYIQIILDKQTNHRKEIIPLITFGGGLTLQSKGLTLQSNPPYSTEEGPYMNNNIKQEYITLSSKKKKELTEEDTENDQLIEQILVLWNATNSVQWKSVAPLRKNFKYWLKTYSVEEIKQAIKNIKLDDFWKDKITPVIFLRRRNQNQEEVDNIGKFLNLKGNHTPTNNGYISFDELERRGLV